jgi:DNA-binding MarR family transcriptional regulator
LHIVAKYPSIDAADPVALRAWRDATLYRLVFRTSRAEMAETLARLRRKHPEATLSYTTLLSNLDTGGTTISALARRAGVTRQAASQQIADIERAGYVVRVDAPDDARAVLVKQTPKGRALLQDAIEMVGDIEAEYAAHVGVDRIAELKALLTDLLAHIDPEGALGRD